MNDPDQCIICLESLEPPPKAEPAAGPAGTSAPSNSQAAEKCTTTKFHPAIKSDPDENNLIATLDGCNHVIHDRCIRSWAENSNTCPICRAPFNEVRLTAELDGPQVDSYVVQDKKQTHEFDLRQWLQENPEVEAEEEDVPCPICNSSDMPEVLLLCDACDAAYHIGCVGLDHVPDGQWYCMECADFFSPDQPDPLGEAQEAILTRQQESDSRRPFPRTRARQRRARRQARSVEWQGAWGQITGRIFDATNIDLDNHEDDDALEEFRRSQQQHEREAREYREWEQRLQIASRQGARAAFARNIPREIGERLDIAPPIEETADERRAWGALDKAREAENSVTPNRRKRKSRSTTASPREAAPEEPQRKLKRPRTRRFPVQGEASGSSSNVAPTAPAATAPVPAPAPAESAPTIAASPITSSTSATPAAPLTTASPSEAAAASPAPVITNGSVPNGTSSTAQPARVPGEGPSFLSSLLREVEMITPSDDENIRNFFNPRSGADPSSPVTSPSPSSRNSPRALSLTPPPVPRPSSPSTLSSYVEPVFPKANYSPTRTSGETSDSESRARGGNMEIRQPRPRRPGHGSTSRAQPASRSHNTSPSKPESKPDVPLEEKEKISAIVRAALKPHWHAKELTADQYASINRDVSRKLYDGLRQPPTTDEDAKKEWEQIATREVARAVSDLKA